MFDMLYILLIFVACLTLFIPNKSIYLILRPPDNSISSSGGRQITLVAAVRKLFSSGVTYGLPYFSFRFVSLRFVLFFSFSFVSFLFLAILFSFFFLRFVFFVSFLYFSHCFLFVSFRFFFVSQFTGTHINLSFCIISKSELGSQHFFY